MKMIPKLLLLMLCASALIGCGGKPKNISEGIYNCGVKAIKVVDKYLDADLTAEEAREEIQALKSQADILEDSDYGEDEVVSFGIDMFDIEFGDILFGDNLIESETDKYVRDSRNKLASTLGIK